MVCWRFPHTNLGRLGLSTRLLQNGSEFFCSKSNRSSRTFSVSLGETKISVAMLTIQDVITENAQVDPPFKFSTHDPCCFACVRYLENGEAKNLGMLLPTPIERGRFYASMTILTWAMRKDSGKAHINGSTKMEQQTCFFEVRSWCCFLFEISLISFVLSSFVC